MNTSPEASPQSRSDLVNDLESRIRVIEQGGEEQFGAFTRVDWIICVMGAVILPYIAYFLFW